MKFLELPQDLLVEIASKLPISEVGKLLCLSRESHRKFNANSVWLVLIHRDFKISKYLQYRTSNWKNLYRSVSNLKVFTFGEPRDGRLGREAINCELPGLVEGLDKVIQIDCGGFAMMALRSDGKALMWGRLSEISRLHSRPIAIKCDEKIVQINMGREFGIALGQSGAMYYVRDITNPPLIYLEKLDIFPPGKIIQIGGGWNTIHALYSDGSVASIRSQALSHREIFRQETLEVSIAAIPIELNERFIMISAGEKCFGLTNKGRVFGWVDNGGPSTFDVHSSHIPALDNKKITHISSGTCRQVLATYDDEGNVWTFDSKTNEVKKLDKKFSMVTFGDWHSGGLDYEHNAYTWGSYSNGALGQGDNHQDIEEPTLIGPLSDKLVLQIAMGGWHTACLVIERE